MRRLLTPSAAILIASNLVPLAGVLFWDWDLFLLLFLYWTDTAIIGFWTVIQAMRVPTLAGSRMLSGFGALFVAFHAGIFMTVHFVFLWTLFSGPWRDRVHSVEQFIALAIVATGLWLPILVMFVGRGVVMLFDLRKAVGWMTSSVVPPEPATLRRSAIGAFYTRIVIMHLAILGGAFLAQSIGSIAPLIVLIAIKTAIDLGFEFRDMREQKMEAPSAVPRG